MINSNSVKTTDKRLKIAPDGSFTVKNYNDFHPFSNFLPGVAGRWGIPLWLYYVNRGQCVACFGTDDKDSAILEFQSAHKHHRRTALEGFRTFIRIKSTKGWIFYEPFKPGVASRNTEYSMCHSMYDLSITEINRDLGIRTDVEYFTIPGESFPALCRLVRISNLADMEQEIELIDGLPQVTPLGTTHHLSKVMPFLTEVFVEVAGLEKSLPFINLPLLPSDTSDTAFMRAGNFYFGIDENSQLLSPVVDSDLVFGEYRDLTEPVRFIEGKFDHSDWQSTICMSPSAFSYTTARIPAGESRQYSFLFGRAVDQEHLTGILKRAVTPEFFSEKKAENRLEVDRICDSFFMKSGSAEIDQYSRQTFLDNVLRGGFPTTVSGKKNSFVFYMYSRKHGDLERDYNFFQLAPTYFSEGNGNFRDVNQNRRNDVYLNPDVADSNIHRFFSLIQSDGFNPLVCKGTILVPYDNGAIPGILQRHLNEGDHESLKVHLDKAWSPGQLFNHLLDNGVTVKTSREELLQDLLDISEPREDAEYHDGYWIDHWFYNFDLLESYLSVFPDHGPELFPGKKAYTFFDSPAYIRPRSEKYTMLKDGRIRHLGSTAESPKKREMIATRDSLKNFTRTDHGRGEIYQTTLLGKIICLLVNKAALIAPSGLGMEMDNGRPGWCDSINGLPSLFGASSSELFQLVRACRLLKGVLDGPGITDFEQDLPEELFDLYVSVDLALEDYLVRRDDLKYWQKTADARELYREKTLMGFSGKEKILQRISIIHFMRKLEKRIMTSLSEALDAESGIFHTYFVHEALEHKVLGPDPDREGACLVEVTSFKAQPIPFFLEGPVHSLELADDPGETVRTWEAVRRSDLYDRKLGRYKLCLNLKKVSRELGRISAFPSGYLENEAVFVHMEYKYLLKLLKKGAYEQFYTDLKKCLPVFSDPSVYGRSPYENVSFVVTSVSPVERMHGRGFQPRLSGCNTEYVNMLLIMTLGNRPFYVEEGELVFRPEPHIADWLFTEDSFSCDLKLPDGSDSHTELPADSFSLMLFGQTLLTLVNPGRSNTWGKDAPEPVSYRLIYNDGSEEVIEGSCLKSGAAKAIRERKLSRLIVELG